MFGTDVTLGPSDTWTGGKSGGGEAMSITKNGISVSMTSGYNNGTELRYYSGASMTISSSVGNITQIQFTYSNKQITSASVGTWNQSNKKWTGNATSITFSNGGQVKITQIVVTYTGSSPTTYTVTYNSNGGTGTMTDSNSPYNAGSTVTTLSNTFTKDGYSFTGWNTADNGSGTDYTEGATFTINANTTLYAQWEEIIVPPTPVTGGKIYELVTDINDLHADDKIIILDKDWEYAMSTTQNPNNRGTSQGFRLIMNKTVAILNNPSTVQIIQLGRENNHWTLYTGTAGYLYADGSSNNNHLKTQATNNANGQWEIGIDANTYEASIVAQGTNTNKTMQYNSGSNLFSCYQSASQRGLLVYKESSFSETFTIIFVNQLGPDSVKTQSTIGEIITLPSSMDICNKCYGSDWHLEGWVTSLESVSPVYTNDYIPTHDITLYAYYGRGSIETVEVEEYKRVTSALDDWAGDYLIAYSSSKLADGRIGGQSGIGLQNLFVTPGAYLHGDTVIDIEWGDLYNVTLEEIAEGSKTYILKTKDGLTNYWTNNTGNGISTDSKATDYPITVSFISESDIRISLGGAATGSVFRYNTSGYFRFYHDCGQNPVYLYKKQKVKKPIAQEYSTAPECDYYYISTWGTNSFTLPEADLADVTNPSNITIENINNDNTILNKTSLSLSNGEYNVSVSNLTNNSCDKINMLIEGTDSMYLIYKVPIIVSSNVNTQASIFTSETKCATCDVVVLANNTLTADGTTSQNRNVKIYEGGTLSIPNSTTYTVNSLALRRTDNNPSYLSLYGNLVLGGDSSLFLDVYTDPSEWRWLALPDQLNLTAISKTNRKQAIFGTDYLIKTYDGNKRAIEQKNGWIAVSSNKVFSSGEGFIFGVAGDGTIKQEYRFKFANDALNREKANKTLDWSSLQSWGCDKPELRPNHKGWNLIGNAFLDRLSTEIYDPIGIGRLVHSDTDPWDGKWDIEPGTTGKLRYRVIHEINSPGEDGNGYSSELLDDVQLEPFSAFFIQLGGNEETRQTILLKTEKRRNMMRRMIETVDEDDELFLRVFVGNKKTGMFISNKFTEDYEPGDDLESRQTIYQNIGGYKLLYSAINDSIIENGVLVNSPAGHLYLDPKVNIDKF